MKKYNLTKSRYCSAVQCPKMLWLSKNHPEYFDESSVNEAVLETGIKVGDFAKSLFGEYVEIPYGDFQEMINKTQTELEKKTPVIAEATFSTDGMFCRVDLLRNMPDGTVELYEVKSTTSVQDIHYHDVAFQYYVLSKSGLQVSRCAIVHINNQYVRHGYLDINELFVITDITKEVQQMQTDIPQNIAFIQSYLQQGSEPDDDIGMQCFAPYTCGYWRHCTAHLPKPNVFDLSGARKTKMFTCYEEGCVSFEDLNTHGKLSAAQYKQIEHEIYDIPPYIDKTCIKGFLKELSYPLYFLDFESFQPAIPLFDASKPYEQIVFQYSLHYIESEGGALKHKEFLAYPGVDPRRALAEQLCADIPLNVCTTAYNMGFEKGRIRSLAELYPDLADHLMNIHDNIKDLMVPFQKKWYYCRAMQGSYSIKYVLPALFPNEPSLDYHHLEGVHNGTEASATFGRMVEMSPAELEASRQHLLKYCGLDTYAMVKIWEKLMEVVQ